MVALGQGSLTGLRLLGRGRGPPEGTEGLSPAAGAQWLGSTSSSLLFSDPFLLLPQGRQLLLPAHPSEGWQENIRPQTLGVLAEKGQKVSGNRRSIVEAGLAPTPAQEAALLHWG